MWKVYDLKFTFTAPFGASIPRTAKEIMAMLEHRQPSEAVVRARVEAGETVTPIVEIAERVVAEVGADDEEWQPGWATFKRDDKGIYYEARCVRAHIKDCALQVATVVDVKNFRAKVANKVYVRPECLRLFDAEGKLKVEPQATETRYIQVMTRQGPRSSVKYVDYLEPPTVMSCQLQVLDDGMLGPDLDASLKAIFDYGMIHGMGQERSQQWGQYEYELEAQ